MKKILLSVFLILIVPLVFGKNIFSESFDDWMLANWIRCDNYPFCLEKNIYIYNSSFSANDSDASACIYRNFTEINYTDSYNISVIFYLGSAEFEGNNYIRFIKSNETMNDEFLEFRFNWIDHDRLGFTKAGLNSFCDETITECTAKYEDYFLYDINTEKHNITIQYLPENNTYLYYFDGNLILSQHPVNNSFNNGYILFASRNFNYFIDDINVYQGGETINVQTTGDTFSLFDNIFSVIFIMLLFYMVYIAIKSFI